MSVSERIEKILAKREEKVQGYVSALNKLAVCDELIGEAELAAKPIIAKKAIEDPQRIQSIHFCVSELRKKISSTEIASLKSKIVKAQQRCGRSYLNIGILAPWRHGKSQFLCQVFDLNKDEEKYLIPTDSDKKRACTGTTVNYQNGDSNICVFEVLSEDEVKDAIIELCKLCSIYKESLESQSLENLIDYISKNHSDLLDNANENTSRQALREYVNGFSQYMPIIRDGIDPIEFKLGGPEPDERLKDIYSYICFYSDPANKNEHNNFKCLGIKRVSISMPLKSSTGESLGKVRFLDTPGLGESRPNVAENIKNILKEDIDLVICVCQTSKHVDSGDFDKFNTFLSVDFNVQYIGADNKPHDASKCVHYILNVNQKDSSTPGRDIYEAKNLCIVNSLRAVTEGTPIQIEDSRIHYLDAFKDVDIIVSGEKVDNENKKHLDYAEGSEHACIQMLERCLSTLREDIEEVDNFFNLEADNAVAELNAYFSSLRGLVFNTKLQSISKGALQRALLDGLVDKFKGISLKRGNSDNTLQRLQTFVSRGGSDITNEFLSNHTGISKEGNTSIQDVVARFKESQDLLSDSAFSTLGEMAQYSELKIAFRTFYEVKLSECLDVKGINGVLSSVYLQIVDLIVKAFKPVLGADTSVSNIIARLEALKDDYDSCGVIANHLSAAQKTQVVTSVISSYVENDLNKFFHKEQSNYDEGENIGLNRSAMATTFIYWINNICESLNNALEAKDTPGVASFSTLVEKIYRGYEKNVLLKFYSANDTNTTLGSAMCDFYSENIDKLGDIEKRQEYVTNWNNVRDKFLASL